MHCLNLVVNSEKCEISQRDPSSTQSWKSKFLSYRHLTRRGPHWQHRRTRGYRGRTAPQLTHGQWTPAWGHKTAQMNKYSNNISVIIKVWCSLSFFLSFQGLYSCPFSSMIQFQCMNLNFDMLFDNQIDTYKYNLNPNPTINNLITVPRDTKSHCMICTLGRKKSALGIPLR